MQALLLPVRRVSPTGASVLVQSVYEIANRFLADQIEAGERPRDTAMDTSAVFITDNRAPALDPDGQLNRHGCDAYPKMLVLRKTASSTGLAAGPPRITPAEVLGLQGDLDKEFGTLQSERTKVRLVLTSELLGLLEMLAESEDPLDEGLNFPRWQPHPRTGQRLQLRSSDMEVYREEVRHCAAAFMLLLPHIKVGKKQWKRNPHYIAPRHSDQMVEMFDPPKPAGELINLLEEEASPTLQRLVNRYETCRATPQQQPAEQKLTNELVRGGDLVLAGEPAVETEAGSEDPVLLAEPVENTLPAEARVVAYSPWTTAFRSVTRLVADGWRLFWYCFGWGDRA